MLKWIFALTQTLPLYQAGLASGLLLLIPGFAFTYFGPDIAGDPVLGFLGKYAVLAGVVCLVASPILIAFSVRAIIAYERDQQDRF